MSDFIKLDSLDKLKFSSRWKNSKAFHCQGRLINKNGEYVKVTYPGTAYQIMLKKERAFTTFERLNRFTQYVFLNLLTLGLCNLSKRCRHLFTKDKLVCRYAVRFQPPKMLDSKNVSANDVKLEIKKQQQVEEQMEESFIEKKPEEGLVQ